MKQYRAIFFDRDGVLSRNSTQKARQRDRAIGETIGREDFRLTRQMYMEVFWQVMNVPGVEPVDTLAKEEAFWKRWYQLILEDRGVKQDSETIASELHQRFCYHKMMELYPETMGILRVLKSQGFRLGVISDTFPSLEESLKTMGIASFFESFTASSAVGADKRSPTIFEVASGRLGVEPRHSVFVDDCREETDIAREVGFTAFRLDREQVQPDFDNWTIGNLEDLLKFLG